MGAVDERIPKISVIIPVYNAGKYIEKCVNSIQNQTFSDYEMIIVNDGSTDDTDVVCKRLETMDYRIQYICKENEGQGKARNLSIKIARAKWIAFIDADDWVNTSYLEGLYTQAEETDSDLVLCDFIEYHIENGFEVRKSQTLDRKGSILRNTIPSVWAKLWKKSFLVETDAKQPEIFFEDVATVPYLVASTVKIAYSLESIYYYAVRGGSTVRSIATLDDRAEALGYLIDLFKNNQLFDARQTDLQEFVMQRCQADLVMAKTLLEEKYDRIYHDHNDLLIKHFQTSMDILEKRNEFVWGSYNTYRTAKYINRIEIAHRFMASSIISAVSPVIRKINQSPLEREILLRRENVLRDCTKKFMHMNPAELKDVEIVLIDFLDERFPIAREDDGVVTLSDAYLEDEAAYVPREIIEIQDRDELWYAACDQFMEQLQNCFPQKDVFLIRMKLAERHGDAKGQELYRDIDKIREINEILDRYYDYFTSHYENVIEIKIQDQEGYYTDSGFRHGCYPWHLNETMYESIADEIMSHM